MKHMLQVSFRTVPTSNSITEKYEILNDATRINAYHATDASKSWILFLIISNVSKWGAPNQIWKLASLLESGIETIV